MAAEAPSVDAAAAAAAPIAESPQKALIGKLEKLRSVRQVLQSSQSRQAKRVATLALLGISDEGGLSKRVMHADFVMENVSFAHNAGFNLTQTRVFLDIMESLENELSRDSLTPDGVGEILRNHLVPHLLAAEAESPADADEQLLQREEAAAAAEKERLDAEAKEKAEKKAAKKPAAKRQTSTVEQPVAEATPAAPLIETTPQIFHPIQAKEIVDFVTQGLLAHWRLYAAALSSSYTPPATVIRVPLHVETPLYTRLTLDNAEDYAVKQQQEAKPASRPASATQQEGKQATGEAAESGKEAEKTPKLSDAEISALVEKAVAQARSQMDALLTEHAAALTAQVKALAVASQ